MLQKSQTSFRHLASQKISIKNQIMTNIPDITVSSLEMGKENHARILKILQ